MSGNAGPPKIPTELVIDIAESLSSALKQIYELADFNQQELLDVPSARTDDFEPDCIDGAESLPKVAAAKAKLKAFQSRLFVAKSQLAAAENRKKMAQDQVVMRKCQLARMEECVREQTHAVRVALGD